MREFLKYPIWDTSGPPALLGFILRSLTMVSSKDISGNSALVVVRLLPAFSGLKFCCDFWNASFIRFASVILSSKLVEVLGRSLLAISFEDFVMSHRRLHSDHHFLGSFPLRCFILD